MMLHIEKTDWSTQAGAFLAPAMRHEPGVTVATLERLVTEKNADLFVVLSAGEMVGAYVLRVEEREQLNEGVIVAAGGNLPGCRLVRSVLPAIEAQQLNGCQTIRIHTARPAMVREMRRAGYVVREVVLAKDMQHGRQ